MADALLRIGVLVAIFASVFIISQFALNTLWARRSHARAVNKRLQMIGQGSTRDQVLSALRKNQPGDYTHYPPVVGKLLASL
ncbi:MAG TPA: hypothetical protein VFS49_10670, partial [Croceibacterium sp.]|nr:hypothetical protein [Croceibacterium sp.]